MCARIAQAILYLRVCTYARLVQVTKPLKFLNNKSQKINGGEGGDSNPRPQPWQFVAAESERRFKK
jgi:hypothetical protein